MLTSTLYRLFFFFLDVVLLENFLLVKFGVLVVVLLLGGECVIRTTVQETIDQTYDEHLHDHHLLT